MDSFIEENFDPFDQDKLILDINSGKIEIFDDKLDQERVKGVLVD